MEIKTRFGYKDKIWVVYYYEELSKEPLMEKPKYEIMEFEIRHIIIDCNRYISYVDNNGFQVLEQDCFATQVEAQAECDKRNKGE